MTMSGAMIFTTGTLLIVSTILLYRGRAYWAWVIPGGLALVWWWLTGVRLSCQILCDQDMTVRVVSRLEGTGRPDPGDTPAETIMPAPEWL